METFVRVVEAGSISKAAEQLGMAKSGVSRRLAELESRLGVRLMNRTTRRSSLTEAGQSYYEGALKLLMDLSELNATTADANACLEGTLRLAAPLSFGLLHLAPAIDEFLDLHPDLRINIDFSDRHIDLVEQGVDLAVRIADLGDSTLRARRICPVRIVICASPDYLEVHGTPRVPADLEDHRILQYDIGTTPVMRLQGPQGNLHLVSTPPAIVANNGDFLRDMAMAGRGITVTPTLLATLCRS
jgi:DNA-binding transcriptional LysR family regulator